MLQIKNYLLEFIHIPTSFAQIDKWHKVSDNLKLHYYSTL